MAMRARKKTLASQKIAKNKKKTFAKKTVLGVPPQRKSAGKGAFADSKKRRL
jgi:hypothetical protein